MEIDRHESDYYKKGGKEYLELVRIGNLIEELQIARHIILSENSDRAKRFIESSIYLYSDEIKIPSTEEIEKVINTIKEGLGKLIQ